MHKFDERILILRAWICDYVLRDEALFWHLGDRFARLLAAEFGC